MRVSSWAVSRPITTFMACLAIVVLGIVSYQQLAIQLIPDITLPTVAVYANSEKSTQENLDKITKEVEAIVGEMSHVKRIFSITAPTFLWVRADFEYGTNIPYVMADLEERIATFRNKLVQENPDDRRVFIDAFPFSTEDFASAFMFLEVRGDGDIKELFDTASDKVEQQLKSINGVAKVEMRGLTADAAAVTINPDLLGAYQLNFGNVMRKVQLAAADNTFLGSLKSPSETFYVRLNDKVTNVEQLSDIRVDDRGIVRLSDVALIEVGQAVDQWVYRSMGKNSIGIRMDRESGENMIELAGKARERVEEINATLPEGVELAITEDLAKYVEDAISSVKKLAGIGALLSLLVPLVFFRSIRVALIVFISVPISLIAVFNLFYAAGMSINIFSVVGLALGVGMLVDNSIVVVENSFRLHGKGLPPKESAQLGGVEVGRGLLAATLTTVAVFVPMLFLDGEFKLFIKEPTLALVFPLLLSLLVALTIVPVMTYLVLRTIKPETIRERRSFFQPLYAPILKASMRHRGRVIAIIALALLLTSLEACQRIKESTTSQEANSDFFSMFFRPPQGATLSEVNRSAIVIEDRLAEHPDIETFAVGFSSDRGFIDIKLKPLADREGKRSMIQLRQTMIDFIGPIPGVEVSLQRFDEPVATPPINLGLSQTLELRGLDIDVLLPYASRLIDALRNHPMITNAEVVEERSDPLYLANIDREKTRLFDMNAQQLSQYVGATRASGTISQLQLADGDDRINVSFYIEGSDGSTVDEIKQMTVWSPSGGTVPLGELVRMAASQSQNRVRRVNRQSSLQVAYYYTPGADMGALTQDIKKIVQALPNPAGITVDLEGEAMRLDRRQADFFFMILAGTLLVYVVMAAVFESFWVPFVIVLTNPLMLIGIVWGLDFAGLPLDDLAAFGVILLVGLAVNNGIVLMDRALTLQRNGISRTRAVYEASLTRLRPIMMTYMTTALGLAPMAMFGEEGDQWRPVAVVIIGGLTSATILTLVVLPCFYLIGDDFVQFARRPFLGTLAWIFQKTESIINRTTTATLAVVCFWRWRPLRWPKAGWGAAKAATIFLVKAPFRLIRAAWRSVKAVLRFIRSVFGDVLLVARRTLRRSAPRAGEATPFSPPQIVGNGDVPAVALSNIQVIFPPTGLAALRRFLPRVKPAEGVHALKGINVELDRGLFGLLGPNGAGKTTLMRAVTGLLQPTRGSVRIFGVSHREAPAELAPLIGYLPQNHGHYGWMTLFEYLEYFAILTARTTNRARALGEGNPALRERLAQLAGLDDEQSRRAAIIAAANEVNLGDVLDRRLSTFSGGMRQRAGIARVLLQAPPILIVDEPTAGLDPVERVKVRLLLSRLAEERLVIFSTHLVEDLEHACTRIGILSQGRMLYCGDPAGLREHWHGKVWDVPSREGEQHEALRSELSGKGARVLFQVVGDEGEAFRVLAPESPRAGSTMVEPSLEVAMLAAIGEKANGTA